MIKLNLDNTCFTYKPNTNELRILSNRIASQTVEYPISTIANKVGNNGQTFTPAIFKHQYRKAENFESMQLFALDFDDENITYTEIKRRANEYQIPFAFSYKTFSYTNEHERFRMVFLLDVVITDKNIAEMIILMLSKLFPECDNSCKDISRMFLGGIGILDTPAEVLSLKTLIDVFQKSRSDNDSSRHFKRDMQSFSRKYKVGVSDNFLIDITYEYSAPKNGALSTSNNYIYISNVDKAPFFCVLKKEDIQMITSDTEKSSIKTKTGTHTRLRSSYLKKARDTCKLLRDSEENIYSLLSHDERFGLLCNLLHIEGGSEYFLSLIERDNNDKYGDWKQNVQYMKRKNYNDIKCSKFCKYHDTDKCRNTDKSLLYTLKKGERYEFLDSEMKYTSLDDAYHDLQEKFTEVMNSQDNDIHVLEAQTAIGKTSIYTSYIEKNYKNSRFLIAVPTNQLKNEVTSVLTEKNIPVVTSMSVTELDCLPFDLREQIQDLYNMGHMDEVKKLLKKLVKKNQKLHQLEDEIFKLFSFTSLLSDSSTHVVVTTHNMLLYLSQNNIIKNILNDYQLIIDEDIIPTIINSQKIILMSDVEWLLDSDVISKEETTKSLEFLKSIPLDNPICYTGAPIHIDFKIQDRYCFGSNFNDLRPGSILIKSKFDKDTRIQYFYPYKLPYQKAVILSATSNSYIYKNYFKDRTVDYIICKKALLKGHIYQFPFHSCSRNSLKKKDIKKMLSHIREQHGNIPVISFKEYNFDEQLHFGNTEGINIYKGKNIAILGTPHLNSNVYMMLAFAIDHNVQAENVYMRKVTYKDIRFPFMTYKNVLLQNIQIYFISKELEQAVGRARALRYNSNIYVYSDFPVEQAEFIMDDYLV